MNEKVAQKSGWNLTIVQFNRADMPNLGAVARRPSSGKCRCMDDGPTIDGNNSGTRRAALALGIALFLNAVWIGLLLWLAIWSTRLLVAEF